MASPRLFASFIVMLAGFAVSGFAYAHPSHEAALKVGALHPLTGMDHLIAILSIGIWASQQRGLGRWAIPLSFITVMMAGAVAAVAGLPMAGVELGIAGSVLLFAVLVGLCKQLPPVFGGLLAGGFAFFHGFAHGAELPLFSNVWLVAIGFLATTGMLLVAGLALGKVLRRFDFGFPIAGALLFAGGSWAVL